MFQWNIFCYHGLKYHLISLNDILFELIQQTGEHWNTEFFLTFSLDSIIQQTGEYWLSAG